MKQALFLAPLFLAVGVASATVPVDPVAAEALLRSARCVSCHAVDKEKLAPAFTVIAKKYDGNSDAKDKLYKFLTVPTTIVDDGEKVVHKIVKPANEKGTRNLISWILSLSLPKK